MSEKPISENHVESRAEFRAITHQLLLGEMTPEQFARLEALMIDDPAARNEYLDQVDVHLGLEKLASVRTSGVASTFSPSGRESSWLIRSWMKLSLAASLLFCLALLTERFIGSPRIIMPIDEDVATAMVETKVRLSQNNAAQFFGELSPTLGSVLNLSRPYVLTSGSVELRFPSGASAIIDAPAMFKIASNDQLDLDSGNCSVHAPDGAEGFRVETPLAKVIDLGTRFAVSVRESGETEVQVVEGEAKVVGKSNDADETVKTTLLKNRDTLVYSAEKDIGIRQVSFDAEQYRYGLRDRIVGYEAAEMTAGDVRELRRLSVQRGGNVYDYDIDELIPAVVASYRTNESERVLTIAYEYDDEKPFDDVLALDRWLDTGLINPGGAKIPLSESPTDATPGLGIRFSTPVINSIGPDLVLFELQSYSNPLTGDAFHVSPLEFRQGLRSLTVKQFDISLISPEARQVVGFGVMQHRGPVHSLADLATVDHTPLNQHLHFRAIAVAIDLSDLGYDSEESVDGLFFQDAMNDDDRTEQSMVDPVYIGGFPAVQVNQ